MADENGTRQLPEWMRSQQRSLLLFRVNRRPPAEPGLFDRDLAFNQHVQEALLFGEEVITGRRHQRIWALGDQEVHEHGGEPHLTGRIGYIRAGQRLTAAFDPELKHWREEVQEAQSGVFAPFFLNMRQGTRLLGVLRHPTFAPQTLATVFTQLLDRGEARRGATTDWAVEPIGNPEAFVAWLGRTDVVTRIRLVVKMPNPDALEGFEYIHQRLDELEAGTLREDIEAAHEGGLRHVQQDESVRGAMAAQQQGFGYVTGRGQTARGPTSYDGREKLEQVALPGTPQSWSSLVALGLEALASYVRERRQRG